MAFNFNDFMTRVKVDNPQFKRFTRSSSLDPLILELKDKLFFTQVLKEKIERIIAFLPFDKQKQYDKSLAYLSKELNIRVGAIPCNPVMKFVKFRIIPGMFTGYNTQNESKTFSLDRSPESIGPRSFVHVHRISWSSSNGNAQSLSTVRTREHVKFLEDTQAKPFNNIQDPDREFYHPGITGSVGATGNEDEHSTKLPALICCNPRQTGTLLGEQWYQYSLDNGLTWKNIEGAAYQLIKSVHNEGNEWIFTFIKKNWLPYNQRNFHFEVQYKIGDAPPYLPRVEGEVIKVGFAEDADINEFARKVKIVQ